LIHVASILHDAFHLAVVDVAVHHEPLFAYVFYLVHHLVSIKVVVTFTILVHDVLAKAVVPSLELVVNYFVVYKGALDVTVAVKA